MKIHYYLTLFPVEALIASQLTPVQFGSYMATGSKKGSFENIIFIELTGEFGDYFDWKYAHEKCVPHGNGNPKNSLYLSVYRTLEHIPFSVMDTLYLTTRDGRTLPLEKSELERASKQTRVLDIPRTLSYTAISSERARSYRLFPIHD